MLAPKRHRNAFTSQSSGTLRFPESEQGKTLSAANGTLQGTSDVLPNERALTSCVEQEANQHSLFWRDSPCPASLQQHGRETSAAG